MVLTEQEIWVREQLTKLYPQLVINARNTCGSVFDKYGYDLIAVCVEFFLKKPIQVQIDAFNNGTAENFITYMMGLQLKSSNTHFYKYYRKHHEKQREYYEDLDYTNVKSVKAPEEQKLVSYQPEIQETDLMQNCLKVTVDKLNPYEVMLVRERLIEGKSYTYITKKYGIPYQSVSNDSKQLRKYLHKTCKHLL
jgi:hypothetical protein